MTIHLHILKGCSPAPLANYLKALGILRLVGEQTDKQARGWWDGQHFCLLTTLSQDELESFFLDKYSPTPLLSPWNKGCGFFKAGDPGLAPLETSHANRFEKFRQGIVAARCLTNAIGKIDAAIRAIKARTKATKPTQTTPNKSFQTEEQRQQLELSTPYLDTLQELESLCGKSNIVEETKIGFESEIKTIRELVCSAIKIGPAEATNLKNSPGYKRLLAVASRQYKTLKDDELIPNCRRSWRGPHAEWLSAAVVLDENGAPKWPSLLGTGGNDGNLDFTNNFMQQLGKLFNVSSSDGGPKKITKELLRNALWMDLTNNLSKSAIGQFQPGSSGGANSSTGADGESLVNAWDFVLMLEGSLFFTSRSTRRLAPNEFARASAPFAVRFHAAGFSTPGSEKTKRGEQWMPFWNQPATLADVAALFGEARVQLHRRTANRPVEMARAISQLGVARGVDSFMRYGYLERNGQSTLAVPLGIVNVRHHPRAHLIDDIAGWMDRLQFRSRDKNAPARLIQAERQLSDAVFSALTHDYSPERWQGILTAASSIESLQATGTAIEAGPIPPLGPEWVSAVNDGSPEVRLALALGSTAAGYAPDGRPIDPIRHHWLPLEKGARQFKTSDKRLFKDSRVVASNRGALTDLSAVVLRRLIEAGMKGKRRSQIIAAKGCSARLDDLAEFLEGSINLDKLMNLARAFMAIKWNKWSPNLYPNAPFKNVQPSEAWLAIRLGCLPWPLAPGKDIPADLRIARLLIADESSRSINLALTRLRSAGIRLPLQAGVTDSKSCRLWAAGLAFPLNRGSALRAAAILDPALKGLIHA
jgi:CRISPR-associated protein Csx17